MPFLMVSPVAAELRIVIMLSMSYFCFYMPVFVISFLTATVMRQRVSVLASISRNTAH